MRFKVISTIVDGTGFGYKREAYLNWMRVTEVRKVKDHMRCEVLITHTLVSSMEVDKAYSSEIKMFEKMLSEVEIKGKRFIADRMYDVIWLEEYLRKRGIEVVIKRKKNSKREGIDKGKYGERNAIEGLKHEEETR